MAHALMTYLFKLVRWLVAGSRRVLAPPTWMRAVLVTFICLGALGVYCRHLDEISPIKDWYFWVVGTLWLYNGLLFTTFLVGGFAFARVLRLAVPAIELVLFSLVLGIVEFCLGMYVLGALALYNVPGVLSLSLLMIASGARPFYSFVRGRLARRSRRGTSSEPRTPFALVLVGLGAIGLALVYFPLLTAEPINHDAAWCHLPVAQDYAREGKIVPFAYDYARNMPQLMPIIHTWGWELPVPSRNARWMMPLHTEFFMFVVALLGVAAMAAFLLHRGRVRQAWVVFILFPGIAIYDANIGGSADHFLAVFAAPIFLAAARLTKRFSPNYAILLGLMCGGAILTKYQGVYLVAGCGSFVAAYWLWEVGKLAVRGLSQRRSGKGAADVIVTHPLSVRPRYLSLAPILVLGTFVLTAAPHFIKNWVFYENPIYPFAQDWIPSHPTLPDAAATFDRVFKYRHPGADAPLFERIKVALELMFTFAFEPHYSFTKEWPTFGALFSLLLPACLFIRHRARVLLAVVASLLCLFAWAMVMQVDRHLQTFAPLLMGVTAATIVGVWELGLVARFALAPLLALQLVWGADTPFLTHSGHIHQSIQQARSSYDKAKSPPIPGRLAYVALLPELPPTGNILLHYELVSLGLDRRVVLDWPGFQSAITYSDLAGPLDLQRYYRSHDISAVLDRPQSRPGWNLRDDVLFADFARLIPQPFRKGGYRVLTLPEEDLPSDPESYYVATIGMVSEGYEDGIYLLSETGTHFHDLRPGNARPKPRWPLVKGQENLRMLLGQARAICARNEAYRQLLGPSGARGFSPVVKYPNSWSIYFRAVGREQRPQGGTR